MDISEADIAKVMVESFRLCLGLTLCTLIIYTIWRDQWMKPNPKKQLTSNTSEDMKYILIWNGPFKFLANDKSTFEDLWCPMTNCYVTDDRNYLHDITKFDAVMFQGTRIIYMKNNELPQKRSPKQKYVFSSEESSHYYPACNSEYNDYFNWTWTYKLDSDRLRGYLVVHDINGTVIGPNKEMKWLTDMKPIGDDLKKKLKTKRKAVAWFVSNCHAISKRMEVALAIDKKLSKYNYNVDIFGKCGNDTCSDKDDDKCWTMLENDYFFYLSFENSFSEDYVTEKLLIPLKHNAVPIVYGFANYTRFVPNGIYLDAMKNSTDQIVASILEAIRNPEVYFNYFKWKNHYFYNEMTKYGVTNEYCKICENLNNKTLMETHSAYTNFTQWWNTKYENMCSTAPTQSKATLFIFGLTLIWILLL